MPVLEHDGIHFYYDVVGQGQPLVMCHRLTGDLNAPNDLLGAFPGYRLIFLEARAHGKTEPLAIDLRERLVRIPGDCPIQNWEEVELLKVPARLWMTL